MPTCVVITLYIVGPIIYCLMAAVTNGLYARWWPEGKGKEGQWWLTMLWPLTWAVFFPLLFIIRFFVWFAKPDKIYNKIESWLTAVAVATEGVAKTRKEVQPLPKEEKPEFPEARIHKESK